MHRYMYCEMTMEMTFGIAYLVLMLVDSWHSVASALFAVRDSFTCQTVYIHTHTLVDSHDAVQPTPCVQLLTPLYVKHSLYIYTHTCMYMCICIYIYVYVQFVTPPYIRWVCVFFMRPYVTVFIYIYMCGAETQKLSGYRGVKKLSG